MRTLVRILTSLFALCLAAPFGCKKWIEDASHAAEETGDDASPTSQEAEQVGEDQELVEKNEWLHPRLPESVFPSGAQQPGAVLLMGRSAPGTGTKTRKVNGIERFRRSGPLPGGGRSSQFAATEASGDGEESRRLRHRSPRRGSIVNEAHEYYERGDYKTDRMMRAKQLHPKLVGAFDAFDKAGSALSEAVDQVQEDLDKRGLVRIEREEGKRARWHVVQTMVLAKPILHEIAKEPSKIRVSAAGASCGGFEGALAAFDGGRRRMRKPRARSPNFWRRPRSSRRVPQLGASAQQKKPFTIAEQKRLGTRPAPPWRALPTRCSTSTTGSSKPTIWRGTDSRSG